MSQLTKKFIATDAVDDTKIKLGNNAALRARNAANTADLALLKANGTDQPQFDILPVVNAALAVPSTLKQLATVEYVQNVVAAKGDAKDSVDYLADVNVPLTGAIPLVIDGGTLAAGQRVLLTAQTTGSQNFIYMVGIVSTTYTLTRATDSNTNAQVTSGAWTRVTQGTVYQGYEAMITTPDSIVLDTTALTVVKYPSTLTMTAGDMLLKTGNNFTVDLQALGGLESSIPGNVAGQLRVKIDQAALEKDKTTRLDPTTGAVMAKKFKKASFTLIAGDITNQFVDLPDVAADSSVYLAIAGAGEQIEGVDYSVNYTGGASSKTRITFAGGLATAGASALVATDVLSVSYAAF
jgi:hypothetical protein